MERIYVGGFDPPRLTAQEVVVRIRKIPGIEVVSASSDESSPGLNDENRQFCHLNVKISSTEKKKDDDDDDDNQKPQLSAFDMVVKHYHNVKWKGCKLSVERPRPNFLERLVEERRQRLEEQEKEEQAKLATEKEDRALENDDQAEEEEQAVPKKTKRHLRVRRRFGEEAYHIDTKPVVVEGKWSDFSKALWQTQMRREKYREKQMEAQKVRKKKQREAKVMAVGDQMRLQPFLNRAVHLRFVDDDDDKTTTRLSAKQSNADGEELRNFGYGELASAVYTSGSSDDDDDDDDEDDDEDEDDEDDSEKEQSESEGGDNAKEETKGTYEWSENEDSDDEGGQANVPSDTNKLSCVSKASEYEDASSVSKENNDTKTKSEKYQWSSDDDDDESDDDTDDEIEERTFRPYLKPADTGTDEFAAAIDLSEDEENDSEEGSETKESSEFPEDDRKLETSENLQGDVETNLGVLSKLFPEMARVTAKSVERGESEAHNANEATAKGAQKSLSGWEGGAMQRFDPTKESAKKFIVSAAPAEEKVETKVGEEQSNSYDEDSGEEEEVEMKVGKENSESSPEHSGEDEMKKEENSTEQENDANAVYEQNKLENVFREARESQSEGANGFKLSSHFQEELKDDESNQDDGGAFSFGFDLGKSTDKEIEKADDNLKDDSAPKDKEGEAFSFGFDLGKDDSQKVSSASLTEEAEKSNNETAAFDLASSDQRQPIKDVKTGDRGDSTKEGQKKNVVRRRGLVLPQKVIDEYSEKFYNMNEGTRMLEDLEGFRRDYQLKENWNRERSTLTLDWKRKRKYAQSRMQKKMRFR